MNLAISGVVETSSFASSEFGSMSVKSEKSKPGATEQPKRTVVDIGSAACHVSAGTTWQKQLAAAADAVDELTIQLDKEKAKLLDNAGSRQNELVKSRAELEALIKQLAEVQKKTQEQKKIKIVIPEIPQGRRETVADMEAQLAAIKDRLAVLQRNLNEKKKPPEEAEVSILPGGTGLSFTPSFSSNDLTIAIFRVTPPVNVISGTMPTRLMSPMERDAIDRCTPQRISSIFSPR